MSPLLLAAALGYGTPNCADLSIANPRLKVVRAIERSLDDYVVTVDVRNRGSVAQPDGTRQHLAIVRNGALLGTQTIPPLGPEESYAAAFVLEFPHNRKREQLTVEFRYVLDSKNTARANCASANDRLTATL